MGRIGKADIKLVIGFFALVAIVIASRSLFDFQAALKALLDWIRKMESWAPLLYIGIYILATVLFVPGLILTMGAGILFGVLEGSATVSIAATLGATAAFLIGRYFARGWVEKRIQGRPKFDAVNRAVAGEGWKIVLLTRLSPIFPFNLLNYAYGVTRVSLGGFVLASWIGMLPGTVLYVYIGSLIGSLALLGAQQRSRTTLEWVFYGVGLLAAVAVTLYVTRLARSALEQRVLDRNGAGSQIPIEKEAKGESL